MPPEERGTEMGWYDIHCHLLPGIDDGQVKPSKLEEVLLLYKESGFSGLVFTPHLFNPYLTTNVAAIRPAWNAAQAIARQIDLDVMLGSELFFGSQEVLQGIPFGGRYQLVEFPTAMPPKAWEQKLGLLAKSVTPIIAHVERYHWMSVESEAFGKLMELGCLIQCNVDGIENARALPYLEAGVVDVIADDNHMRPGSETLPYRLIEHIGTWPEVSRRMLELFP